MIRVSDEVKTLFKSDNVPKYIEIRIPEAEMVITNDDILCESLELNEAIETSDNLTFTGCIASSFKIETVDIAQDIEGLWMEVDMDIDEYTIPIFRGYIDTVTNTTHEEYTTEIRAYDALYKICSTDVSSWYNGLSFPITVKNMRDSFFNFFGVEQEIDYLPNDSMTVYKTIQDAVIEGSKIIKPLCQINGRYGQIGRNGKFKYVHLVEGTEAIYPSDTLYPSDDLYPHAENASDNVSKGHYESIKFENYDVAPITKVQLIGEDGSVVATSGIRAQVINTFTIHDNPLIYGKTSSELNAVASNLYNTIRGLWYRPSDITCVGLPYIECGDFVLMVARRSIVRAYVLTRKLKGVYTLKDAYTSKGNKYQPPYVPNIKQQVSHNASEIKKEKERASSAESGLNSGLNNANNRINSLQADNANIRNLVATKASIDQLNATNANVGSLNAQVANLGSVVAGKADISQLNAANARIDYLSGRVSDVALGQFRSVNCNNITSGSGSFSSCTVGGRNVDTRFGAIESYITRFATAMRNHGWSY